MTKQQEWYWNDQEWDKQDIEIPIVWDYQRGSTLLPWLFLKN